MTLHQVATKVCDLLLTQQLTVATAESCTAGGLSYWLTQLPGSSAWFLCGFVTYHNHAKEQLLGVTRETLDQFGAVSKETAQEMAKGALSRSEADLSVAITGIAGPSGGSIEKPVGTVWIAISRRQGSTTATPYLFQGDRASIREQSIRQALINMQTLLTC